MRQNNIVLQIILAAALLWVWLGAGEGPAWGVDKELLDAAEKEKEVVLYTCDPDAKGLFKRFKELYPKVSLTSSEGGCWQAYNRHATERSAGKQIADVFYTNPEIAFKMQQEGQLVAYESKELGNFPKTAHEPGKLWTAVKILLVGFPSNPEYMKGIPKPQDWMDFANPPKEWYQKISVFDPRTSGMAFTVLSALYMNLGKEKAGKIYNGLRTGGAEICPTTPVGVTKLLSGEKPIMFYVGNNHFSRAVRKGAPLTFTIPKSGSVANNMVLCIFKNAPHPNAGRLFIEYMLTDAQKVMVSEDDYALRIGTPPPKGLPELASIKFLNFDYEKALPMQAELLKWWQGEMQVK